MNIVLLHYAAPPVVGGVETVLARQAQLLVRAGHQVRVVTGRGQTWDAQIPVEVYPLLDSRHPKVLKAKPAWMKDRSRPTLKRWLSKSRQNLRQHYETLTRLLRIMLLHCTKTWH
jgi:glycosyltransferase involved in cell wall biosynthesis